MIVIVAWSLIQAAFLGNALLSKGTILVEDYVVLFVVAVIGGLVIGEIGPALIGFLSSIVFSASLLYFVLILPFTSGSLADSPLNIAFSNVLAGIVLIAFFPFAIITDLLAVVIGVVLRESRIGERLQDSMIDRKLSLLSLTLLLFLGLSLVSATIFSAGAANYLGFYDALSTIQVQRSELSLDQGNDLVSISTSFSMENLSGYRGFRVRGDEVFLHLSLNGQSRFIPYLNTVSPDLKDRPFDPGSRLAVEVKFSFSGSDAQRLVNLTSYGESFKMEMEFRLFLSSWLDNYVFLSLIYTCPDGPGIVNCLHESIVVERRVTGGGGR